MNFKGWLREEKGGGGFGAFLIIVIIAAAIYAVQFGPSNLLYEPEPAFAAGDFVAPEEEYGSNNQEYPESTYTRHTPTPTPQESYASEPEETEIMARAAEPEARKEPAVTTRTKNKSRETNTAKSTTSKPIAKSEVKAKPKRNRLSNEEIIKRKLDQGKTVKQIAYETGLDKRYIREVKRRTQQVIW